jgi:hypothetical protein
VPYGTIEDDFKLGRYGDDVFAYLYNLWGEPRCCCIAAKCHMPETITVTLGGFWGEWAQKRSGNYFSTHIGIAGQECAYSDAYTCLTMVRSAWYDGLADGLLNLTWYPAREVTLTTDTGSAQLCIQNPEMLEFFPGLDGDPPTPITADAIYVSNGTWDCAYVPESCSEGITFVHGFDVYWRARMINAYEEPTDEAFEQALQGWTVELPSCVYSFDTYAPLCHLIGAHAGDLDGQTAVLRRRTNVMPPVLRPVITRSRAPQTGEVFTDAHLLFDVYLRPFQFGWADRNGDGDVDSNFDGRTARYSVDYVCNPRDYPPDAQGNFSNFRYWCMTPGGIAPPKLQATGGSGGAEIEFTIAPVPGTGSSPTNPLWQVAEVSIKTAGSGNEEGDVFTIDFYEDPPRGGEYKDAEEPQTVVVTSVGDSGEVLQVMLVEPTEGKRVFYGRNLCHPNGVALRGSGYSEGDTIEWVIVDQPPELGGGVAKEYERAKAIVTEVDENGGIIDWHIRGSRHGDGDDEHTQNYLWCEEEHNDAPTCTSDLAAVDCRGLYSDVTSIERCKIIYEGYVGFRATAHREAWAQSLCNSYLCSYRDCSCGGDSACFANYCGINTIPITFEIFDVETRLTVDITLPQNVRPLDSHEVVVIHVVPAEGVTPATPLEIPTVPSSTYGGDFLEVPGPQEAESGSSEGINIGVSTNQDRVGREWEVSAVVGVTYGEIAFGDSGARDKNLAFEGTADEVDAAMADIMYWAPAGESPDLFGSMNGPDLLTVKITITPPGYDQPRLATAKASEILNRCDELPDGWAGASQTCGDEGYLDYWLGVLYLIAKGFEYPDARPLGGISLYEVTDPGAGYAWWDSDVKEWKPDQNLRVYIGSAWDGLRADVKANYPFDLYAHAKAEVDIDVDSDTFGQISSVEPEAGTWGDGKGWFYVIHEYDRMWKATASWSFAYDMYLPNGQYITSGQFPPILHKDGYRFPATFPCDVPNLQCFADSLSSQCEDRTKPCKVPSDGLWSLEYCPHDLFKKYDMLMEAQMLQQPNTPTLLGKENQERQWAYTPTSVDEWGNTVGGNLYSKCTNGPIHLINPDIEYDPCDDICMYGFGSWCEHPEAAVTHDVACWSNNAPTQAQQSWPWSGEGFLTGALPVRSMYLNFGNGPITLDFNAVDNGDERERSIH